MGELGRLGGADSEGWGSEHEWIKDAHRAPDTPLGSEVLSRLRDFQAMNQLKKKALRVGRLGGWGAGGLGD